MDTLLVILLAIVYCVWSVRLGLQFVNGRWEALERPERRQVKIVVSVVLGLLLGAVLIVARIMKFIFSDFPRIMGW